MNTINNVVNIEPYSFGPRGTADKFRVISFTGAVGGNVTFSCMAYQAEIFPEPSPTPSVTPTPSVSEIPQDLVPADPTPDPTPEPTPMPEPIVPTTPYVELSNHMINVTLEQWNTWTINDYEFFSLLATLAGYTPLPQ